MNLRDESRKDFRKLGGIPNENELMIGCAQRIADATELMALDREALMRRAETADKRADFWQGQAEQAERSRNALKGVVTRLKLRIARLEENES